MKNNVMFRKNQLSIFGAAGFSLAIAGSAMAGDSGKVVEMEPAPAPEPWTICNIFDYATLYEDSDNPFLQELALIGRYHGQWHYADSDRGEDSGWENRRFRFGIAATFLHDFEFEGQFNLKRDYSSDGRFFQDVEDLAIVYSGVENLELTVGKFKPAITQEYATSSKRIITFERSLLVNQITAEKTGGVMVTYEMDPITIDLAGFSGDLSDDWALPEFDAGYGLMARLGYALGDTDIRFDYMYQEEDDDNVAFSDYDNMFSLNTSSQWDKFGLNTDIIFATGMGDTEDVFGIVIMPHYQLTDKLQAVFRYHLATSEGNDGIRLQSRYERRTVEDGGGTRGDVYNSFYLGLNYRICKDKLKLMTGVEYATLDGKSEYSGWTYFAGVRTYF